MNWVFNAFGVLLLLQFIRFKLNDYLKERIKSHYWSLRRHKYVVTIGALVAVSLLTIEWLLPEVSPLDAESNRLHFNRWFATVMALAISVNWAVYMRKLDVFEPESWWNLLVAFAFGAITVWLVFPVSALLNDAFGFALNGDPLNDFLYCTIGIGMVEELVKILPLVVLARFPTVVNEPFDYIIYACLSALGFAFVENWLYIEQSDFYAINGRALMSTVAHMCFSSVVGYGMMVSACRMKWRGWYLVVGAFLLASVMHGFYDFWLINPIAKAYSGLSLVFFVITVHFWFTLKNKAINATYFFDRRLTIVNDRVRYYLVTSLVSLVAVSAVLIGVAHGQSAAHQFLGKQIYSYGFLIYYLSFSFSKFKIAPKAMAACQVVIEKAIPKEPDPIKSWEHYHQEKHW